MSIKEDLINCFNEEDNFSISEAVELVGGSVNNASIRARIYEGISTGIFKRISRGVFEITENGKKLVAINGDGRDLSNIKNESVDCIITDHPYDLKKSHKGGSRNLAKYKCFKYSQKDFDEKFRVLKNGSFLCEFLPERNGDNIEYIIDVIEMAIKANFLFYAVCPWKKGSFVINQGRKSKNTEDIYIFTKGKARSLRPDVKKIKKTGKIEKMSGTAKMLPISFDHQPTARNKKIHQAEKPILLYEDLIEYVSLKGELILDQFAGSGNIAIACRNTDRSCIAIEKDEKTFEKMLKNIGGIENGN